MVDYTKVTCRDIILSNSDTKKQLIFRIFSELSDGEFNKYIFNLKKRCGMDVNTPALYEQHLHDLDSKDIDTVGGRDIFVYKDNMGKWQEVSRGGMEQFKEYLLTARLSGLL